MAWLHFSRRSAVVALGAVLMLVGGADRAASQVNAFESFRNALIDYFAALNFVPVLVGRGY